MIEKNRHHLTTEKQKMGETLISKITRNLLGFCVCVCVCLAPPPCVNVNSPQTYQSRKNGSVSEMFKLLDSFPLCDVTLVVSCLLFLYGSWRSPALLHSCSGEDVLPHAHRTHYLMHTRAGWYDHTVSISWSILSQYAFLRYRDPFFFFILMSWTHWKQLMWC